MAKSRLMRKLEETDPSYLRNAQKEVDLRFEQQMAWRRRTGKKMSFLDKLLNRP